MASTKIHQLQERINKDITWKEIPKFVTGNTYRKTINSNFPF